MSIGEKLKKLRKEKKWSQTYLGERIGADARRISHYENNINYPSTETMIKFSEVFGVTLDFFVRDNVKDIATARIDDAELLNLFEDVAKMNKKDKEVVKIFLSSFVKNKEIEKIIK